MADVTLSWTIILFNVALCFGNLYEGDVDFGESAGGKSQKICLKYYNPIQGDFPKSLKFYDPTPTNEGAAAGGTPALPKEFKHMAAVGFRHEGNTLWLCGGTLISEYFILTAAHCTFSREFGAPKVVRLGDLDLKNETDDAHPFNSEIVEIIKHPEYELSAHYNDIALLRLGFEVIFGPYHEPACLYTRAKVPKFLTATEFLGPPSSHLLKVNVSLIHHNTCAKKFGNVRKLPNGILNSQICAGDKDGKDTCPGDSGGPLQILYERSEKVLRHFVVVGITSFGKGCGIGETAAIYTKVSAYANWIENIVWPFFN